MNEATIRRFSATRRWEVLLGRIRATQATLLEDAPYRDTNLVPNQPATLERVEQAERRVGHALPPSYREFLMRHDGWPRFFAGATLLGTHQLGKSSYADLAQAVFQSAETPVPTVGPPSSRIGGYPERLIPFGIDSDGTTLFAFEPALADQDGEMPVIAWIHEIGLRSTHFTAFLETVLELCEADRAASVEAFARSA